jgi:hypothetical protein
VKLAMGGRQTVRDTGPLVIDVSEPPVQGRPPGYEVGTVGDFTLSAELAPRAIEQGGVVTLSLALSGVGNFPTKLVLPAQKDIAFSDPEVKDDFKVDEQGRYGGTRRFTYVVRVARSGEVPFGKVAVPFFDATAARYKVAEVDLGMVRVEPSAAAASSASDASQSKLASLPAPRTSLEGVSVRKEGSLFGFGALAFGGPIMLALAGLASRARHWSRSRAARADTSAGRLASARRALARAQDAEIDAAIVKVIEAAVALHYGVNIRGLASDGVRAALCEASASPATITMVVASIEASELARFMPGEAPEVGRKARVDAVDALLGALKLEER